MKKFILALIPFAVFAQAPYPPGFIPKQPPISPKLAEQKSSWGSPMTKVPLALPKLVELPEGFWITNIVVSTDSITLQWKGGSPPFQVEGEPSLAGPWMQAGRPTMAHSATCPIDQARFFRVQQNATIPFSITHTNPQTLEWEAPLLDMGDSLSSFIMQRMDLAAGSTPPVLPVGDSHYDDNWVDCPTATGFSACPVPTDPNKGTAASPYTVNDTTLPAQNRVLFYRAKEITANGVRVPYNFVSVGGSGTAPGTLLRLQILFSGGAGRVNGIKQDSQGNLIAVGQFLGTINLGDNITRHAFADGATDIFVVKYRPDGTIAWRKIIGDVSHDIAYGVAIDSQDNVIVVGAMGSAVKFDVVSSATSDVNTVSGSALTFHGGVFDIFVVKYRSDGTYLWGNSYGAGTSEDGFCVAVDLSIDPTTHLPRNNIFVGGTITFANIDFGNGNIGTGLGGNDGFLLKLDSSGVYQWVRRIGGSSDDSVQSVVCDSNGDVYAAGHFGASVKFDGAIPDASGGTATNAAGIFDAYLAKYSGANGALIWLKHWGTASQQSQAFGVTIDSNNNVICTGSFVGSIDFGGPAHVVSGAGYPHGEGGAIFVASYKSDGSYNFAKGFGGEGYGSLGGPNYVDTGYAVGVGVGNKVIVGGEMESNYINFDGTQGTHGTANMNAFLLVLDSLGNHVFNKVILGDSLALTAIFNSSGYAVVGGWASGSVDFGNGSVSTGADQTSFIATYSQ